MNFFTAVAGMSAAAVIIGQSAINFVEDLATTQPVEMRLAELRYEDGNFIQRHEVSGIPVIMAAWTAQILRGDIPLCEGGGTAPYEGGQAKRMTPDYWTGDQCPAIKAGDTAIAAWTYTGSDGIIRTISGKITLE